MTSPKHAHATDRGRYYTRPGTGEQLISVTNVLSEAVSKPALVPWAAKMTAEAAWDSLPRMVAAMRRPCDCRPTSSADRAVWVPCGRCAPCLSRHIKGAHKLAAETASDLGTRIHDRAEAHVTGRALPPDPEAEPFVEQYLRFLADFDIDLDRDIHSAEASVADVRAGYAGTLDLLIRLPFDGVHDGAARKSAERQLFLVDIKTSKTRAADSIYDEYALQLTALRRAHELWLPDDTITRMPPVLGTAVLNLRATTYALVPVPSGEPERRAWEGALAVAKWRHTSPTAAARPITPDGREIPKPIRRAAKKAAPAANRKAS